MKEDFCFRWTFKKLLDLLAETEPEHESGAGKSEWKREPNTCQPPIKSKTEEVSGRKGNDKVGDEGDIHGRFYIGNTAECIGVVALHAVAKLVNDERQDEACYHKCYFIIISEPTADFIP